MYTSFFLAFCPLTILHPIVTCYLSFRYYNLCLCFGIFPKVNVTKVCCQYPARAAFILFDPAAISSPAVIMDSNTGTVIPRRVVHMQVAPEPKPLVNLPNNFKRNKNSRRVRILWSLLASPCLVIGWFIYSARRDTQLSSSENQLLFHDTGTIPTMRSATVLPLPTVFGSKIVETPPTFEGPDMELEVYVDADMDMDSDSDSQMDVDIDVPIASLIHQSQPIPPHSLTAILPVTSNSLPNLRSTVTQLLADGGGYLRDIIIACPEEILLQTRIAVRATVAGHVPGGPDISLHRFPNNVYQDQNRNVLGILASHLSSEWVLVLPETGIDTSDLLYSPLDVTLPVGSRGFLVSDSGSNVSCASASVLKGKEIGASYLVPPFIMPSFLVFAFDDDINASGSTTEFRNGSEVDVWALLGEQISKTRSDGFGGIVIPSSTPTKSKLQIQTEPWCSSVLHTSHRDHANGSVMLDSVQGWDSALEGTCAAGSENTLAWNGEQSPNDLHNQEHAGVFALLLPSLQDLHLFSSAVCRLHDRGHAINTFLYDESPSTAFSDEEGDETWVEHVLTVALGSSQHRQKPAALEHCRLRYKILASYMQPLAQRHHPAGLVLQWFMHLDLGSPPDAVLALDEKDAVTDGLALLLTKMYPRSSPTLVRIPRENLVYSDWMGTLSLSELKSPFQRHYPSEFPTNQFDRFT